MVRKDGVGYEFLDEYGTFLLKNADSFSDLYFPLTAEGGLKSSVTPLLGGDCKYGQNEFLLQPVSVEDLHNNRNSRNFWCRTETGEVWSATGVSAKQRAQRFTDEGEECTLTAGPLWHQIERVWSGKLASRIVSWIPWNQGMVEVMHVKLRNEGMEPIRFTCTAAIPVYGRSADNLRDHRHVTSLLQRIRTTEQGVNIRPTLSFDERGHQRNHTTYFVAGVTGEGQTPVGFCPEVQEFIGGGGSFDWPESVVAEKTFHKAGYAVDGYEGIGALRFQSVCLNPGEEADYIILIGLVHGNAEMSQDREDRLAEETIHSLVDMLGNTEKAEKSLQETKDWWKAQINVSCHTADRTWDRLFYWNNVQPILRRIFGCSFLPHHDYGRGGRGWRDLWQDCLALLLMNPEGVRDKLVSYFAGVRMDGTNATIIGERPGEFFADRNRIMRVWMDHGVWPLRTLALYIQQTGDMEILSEQVPYFQDGQILRGIRREMKAAEEDFLLKDMDGKVYRGTILEHLLIEHLTACAEVGDHGYIRLRGADWNDGLDMAQERGESVAFTAAYIENLYTLAELLEMMAVPVIWLAVETEELFQLLKQEDRMNSKEDILRQYCVRCQSRIRGEKISVDTGTLSKGLRMLAAEMSEHIRTFQWLQQESGLGWFNGYYDDHGCQVERVSSDGVRMMLTGQVFALSSGVATDQQAGQIVRSADRYLFSPKLGGYRLNTDFHEVKLDLGRMFGFAYGHKENGAVFSHMTVMYANALYKRGLAKEGYKAIGSLCRQAANFPVSRIYPGIPEYFNEKGQGMYHYLTGAASWLMLTVVTEMFGVKGRRGDMVFEPKLLAEQFDEKGEAAIHLTFAERSFTVIYRNPGYAEYGEYHVRDIDVDGMKLAEGKDRIPRREIDDMDSQTEHTIWILLERKGKE